MSSLPIALIGPTGAGKSTVGYELAQALNWIFVDLDTEIEQRTGESIREIFAKSGEAAFRAAEEAALTAVTEMTKTNPIVCATGGGIITTQSCIEQLRTYWLVIALDVQVETQVNRLFGNTADRPLLAQAEDLATRLLNLRQTRSQLYQLAAHHVISVDALSPEQVVEAILACL